VAGADGFLWAAPWAIPCASLVKVARLAPNLPAEEKGAAGSPEMDAGNSRIAVSVVVVSDRDYVQRSWRTERSLLQALARQDFREPFEVILVENERYRPEIPRDLPTICPRFRIVFSAETQSAKLKNVGACWANAELVAVVDADCLPNEAWLRALVTVLRERTNVSAVSGRTYYGEETSYRRALSLVDRSFDDLGRPGLTPRVSTNAALYRRSLLARFPYPESATPFGSAILRMQAMARAGDVLFFFEPAAVVRHAIGGWDSIRDFRRHIGYIDMMGDPEKRLRSIPRLLWRRFSLHGRDCLRLGPSYLCWYDWPLAAAFLAATPFLQMPGMLDAWRGRDAIPRTSFF